MRWEALFDDLEAQWSARQAEQLEAEVADAFEVELARMQFADRLRASVGSHVQLRILGEEQVRIEVGRVGLDWLSGRSGGRSLLIPLSAVLSGDGLPHRAQPETSPFRRRLGIAGPLRALARSRARVSVQGLAGPLGRGLIVQVSADHFDLALGDAQGLGTGRGQRRSIPMAGLVSVRSD